MRKKLLRPPPSCTKNIPCNLDGNASSVAMSFDLFFQPCRFAGSDGVVGPRNEPLTDGEVQAVRSVLARVCPVGPNQHQCWRVGVGDGGSAELFGTDLRTGCMIALRGTTPDLVQWLFSLLVAGNWVLLPAQEKPCVVTASMDAIRGIPDGFPEVVLCESSDGLGALLAGGIEDGQGTAIEWWGVSSLTSRHASLGAARSGNVARRGLGGRTVESLELN